jgi:AbiTii
VTPPLILQIQQAALDSSTSVMDAFRKAKIACTKLSLTRFGNWVDLELNGYAGQSTETLPEYRKVRGTPEAYSPMQGWIPIIFQDPDAQRSWSNASIGMSIAQIEELLRVANTKPGGAFAFELSPENASAIFKLLNWGPACRSLSSGRISITELCELICFVRCGPGVNAGTITRRESA